MVDVVNGLEIKPDANLEGADLRGAHICDANFDGALISYRGGTVKVRFEVVGLAARRIEDQQA